MQGFQVYTNTSMTAVRHTLYMSSSSSPYSSEFNTAYASTAYDTAWHYVVITYDRTLGANGTAHVYVDDVLKSTPTLTKPLVFSTTQPLYIGDTQGVQYGWLGKIDEVAMWNRALTTTEMSALYNLGSGLSLLPTGDLTIEAFEDVGNDGSVAGDPSLGSGWEFLVTGPGDYSETFTTDENGTIVVPDLDLGNYTITETVQPDWICTTPADHSTSVDLLVGQAPGNTVQFGNYHPASAAIPEPAALGLLGLALLAVRRRKS